MTKYAHIIYSDDIREEVGGKITLVGMYSGKCFVPTFPCTIPKLCFYLTLVTPKDEMFSSVSIVANYHGAELVRINLGHDQLQELFAAYQPIGGQQRDNAMIVVFGAISPLHVAKEGRLIFAVEADGEELPCDNLEICVGHGPAHPQ